MGAGTRKAETVKWRKVFFLPCNVRHAAYLQCLECGRQTGKVKGEYNVLILPQATGLPEESQAEICTLGQENRSWRCAP
eukprot:3627318-Amphidinium_carterae.1